MRGVALKPKTKILNAGETSLTDFTELFEAHQTELLRYLYGLVGEIETARDLAQETFVRGLEWWQTQGNAKTGQMQWRPFLYKIATNCANNCLRRQNKIHFSPLANNQSDETNGEVEPILPQTDPAYQTELRMAINRALAGLESGAMTCLLLYYDQGFSCEEIAEITGSSTAAVWQRLSRARKLFCNLYQKEQAYDV
jgi:RNA polymerase sigma-70 factor, ECF subfamily